MLAPISANQMTELLKDNISRPWSIDGDDEACAEEKALVEHVAGPPEDLGRTGEHVFLYPFDLLGKCVVVLPIVHHERREPFETRKA
jgi:hypothetical protein